MGANRIARRRAKKQQTRQMSELDKVLQKRLEVASYTLTPARLKIAAHLAHEDLRASNTAFRKYPNRVTYESYKRALRVEDRVRGYIARVQQNGFIDLAPPDTNHPGVKQLFGRALDESLLFLMEEEHFRKVLRLKLAERVKVRKVIDGRTLYHDAIGV